MENKDLFKGRTCEICGQPDYLVGVASSSLGAVSLLFCTVCLHMGAEPKWMIDGIFEMDNWRTQYGEEAFTYFDKESGSYKKYGSDEIIPIILKNGMEFKTRKELMEHWNCLKTSSKA